jgi:hypothetical protein
MTGCSRSRKRTLLAPILAMPGVIDVALLNMIRRWHLRDKISIREIARRTKLSRNTITKYLASGETSPLYPNRKSPSRLDPLFYASELTSCS